MAILTRTPATTDGEPNTACIQDVLLSITITETAPQLCAGAQKIP